MSFGFGPPGTLARVMRHLSPSHWCQSRGLGHRATANTNTVNLNTIGEKGDEFETSVIFIHGLLGSSSNFRSVMKQCSVRSTKSTGLASMGSSMARPFYSVDLRNHGASPHVNGPMDPRVLAEDVIRLMDDYDIDIAMLVGHGLGGDTAMAAALWHGDRVDRFMSVEPLIGTATAEQCSTGLTHVVKAMRTVVLDDIHTRADADTMLAASGVGDQALRRFALQNLVMAGADHGGPRWRVNLDALAEDYTLNGVTLIELGLDGIKSNAAVVFEGDAVFVFGELSDRADMTAHSTALCQLFPASKSTSVVSGHWVHLERPSEFVEEVMKFIDR